MKWFFALNESSLAHNRPAWETMILAAVNSARRNTTLRPHFIFDGGDDPFISRLEAMGVVVVRHRVTFYDNLAEHDRNNPARISIASGAFLRVEIPLVEHEDDFVLYTDCDVMFEKDPEIKNLRPRYFACAPEFNKDDFAAFNTGVMVMNLAALREGLPAFTSFIRNNLADCTTFDQAAYRLHYGDQADPLPLELNWKPYWGPSDQAQIVHFHGPKPGWARHLLSHPDDMTVPLLTDIFSWSVAGYEHYVPRWEAMLTSSHP